MPDQGFLRHQHRRAFSAWALLFLALPLLLGATTPPPTTEHSVRHHVFSTPPVASGYLAITEQKTPAAASAAAFFAVPMAATTLPRRNTLTQPPCPTDPVFTLCTVLWQSPALPRPPPNT